MSEATADNGYDPERFIRGMGHAAEQEKDSDSTGMWDRGHASFVTLFTSDQGAPLIPYGGIFGGNQGAVGEKEWFTFNFQALIEFDGETDDGRFQARIEGRHLEQVIRQVRTSKRTTIKVGGDASGDKPSVTSITLVKLEI